MSISITGNKGLEQLAGNEKPQKKQVAVNTEQTATVKTSGDSQSVNVPKVGSIPGNLSFVDSAPVIKFKEINKEDKKANYSVNVKYPVIEIQGNSKIQDEINSNIKNYITSKIKSFKDDIKETYQGIKKPKFFTENEFSVSSTATVTKNILSINLDNSVYYDGAAHGNSYAETLNFDLNTGKKVELKELFKDKAAYVEKISDFCMEELAKDSETGPIDWIIDGTGAEDNISAFTVNDKGINITFSPYQVASYSEGYKDITIPFSVLKDQIDPNGPLKDIVGSDTK